MFDTFFQNLDSENLKYLSYVAIACFAYACLCILISLPLNLPRKGMRFMVGSALFSTSILAMICGVTYIWHHYYR